MGHPRAPAVAAPTSRQSTAKSTLRLLVAYRRNSFGFLLLNRDSLCVSRSMRNTGPLCAMAASHVIAHAKNLTRTYILKDPLQHSCYRHR